MSDLQQRTRSRYAREAAAYRASWAPVLIALGRPLLAAIASGGSRRVLDIGCGVGALARVVRRSVGRAGLVVGVDLTPGMLAEARGSVRGVRFLASDATRLPFRADCFDAAVCTFVLHHFPEQRRAVEEARRVLRPRGRFGMATWGREDPGAPAIELWGRLLDDCGAPEDPDPPPLWEEPIDSPAKVRRLLERAGFGRVEAWSEVREYRWDPEAFIAWKLTMGLAKRRMDAMPRDGLPAFRAAARRRVRALDRDAFVWRPEVVFAIARPS